MTGTVYAPPLLSVSCWRWLPGRQGPFLWQSLAGGSIKGPGREETQVQTHPRTEQLPKTSCLVHGKEPVCPEAAWGAPQPITPQDEGTLHGHPMLQLMFWPPEGGKGISEGLSEGWKAVSTQWLGRALGEWTQTGPGG